MENREGGKEREGGGGERQTEKAGIWTRQPDV